MLICEEQLGLLEDLVLKILEQRFRHNVSYREVNTYIQSIKYNKHGLYECIERRGSDSKNFGTRITGFGLLVGKI
jgi:hypothetical protein